MLFPLVLPPLSLLVCLALHRSAFFSLALFGLFAFPSSYILVLVSPSYVQTGGSRRSLSCSCPDIDITFPFFALFFPRFAPPPVALVFLFRQREGCSPGPTDSPPPSPLCAPFSLPILQRARLLDPPPHPAIACVSSRRISLACSVLILPPL